MALSWARATQKVRQQSMASLAFLIWDICITLDDEVEHIWSKPYTSYIKWLFLLSRYVGLCIQTGSYLATRYIESHSPMETSFCKSWYIYQTATGQFMLGVVQIILMIRVYAFYNRNRLIAFILALLLVTQIVTTTICIKSGLPLFQYTPSCLVTKTPKQILYFGIGTLLCQSVVFILTIFKHVAGKMTGWGRTPVVSIMIRDGTGFYVAFLLLMGSTILYIMEDDSLGDIAYYWLVSIMASAGCRIIINMQQLGVSATPTMSTALTTRVFNTNDF